MKASGNLANYVSFWPVVDRLIAARIGLMEQRRRAERKHSISVKAKKPSRDHAVMKLLPCRAQWVRPRYRRGRSNSQIARDAIRQAVREGMVAKPGACADWLPLFAQFFDKVQSRVFADGPFVFGEPTIHPQPKSYGGNLFRPIGTFGLEDRIIDGGVGAYLRDTFDELFLDQVYSSRSGSGRRARATHNTAFADLLRFVESYRGVDLFVAEADTRSFYDCVDHNFVRLAFERGCADLRARGIKVDPIAISIFEAFLNCYSFERVVAEKAEPLLRKRNLNARFAWPIDDLRELHGGQPLREIGVFQGSAISSFISNLIMNAVDRAVMSFASRRGSPLFYARVCDDMILISPDRQLCSGAFERYCNGLRRAKLPLHPPQEILSNADAMRSKSKQPYLWGPPGRPGAVQWIRFVGYELRCDGKSRISRASVKKHLDRLRAETDANLKLLCPRAIGQRHAVEFNAARRSAASVIASLQMRLMAISTGRVRQTKNIKRFRPLCWLAGFPALGNSPILDAQLRKLDKARAKELRRISSKLKNLAESQKRAGRLPTKHFSHRFSYLRRFATKAGIPAHPGR